MCSILDWGGLRSYKVSGYGSRAARASGDESAASTFCRGCSRAPWEEQDNPPWKNAERRVQQRWRGAPTEVCTAVPPNKAMHLTALHAAGDRQDVGHTE